MVRQAESRGGIRHRCTSCGAEAARWAGRCSACQQWSTLEPLLHPAAGRAAAPRQPARRIAEVSANAARPRPSGVGELDRVLGGGLVPGAVILLSGEPGIGKSTVLLAAAAGTARGGREVLVVTGEESVEQVRLRAERTGALHPGLWLAAETDLDAVLAHAHQTKPCLLVVDSVQTIRSPRAEGAAGGVTQVRAVTAELIALAKQTQTTVVLVGHVTKDGSVAGPRSLEHLVDVVLTIDGEPHTSLRLLRATKNRYGSADEVGCFELSETGVVEIADPGELFRAQHTEPVSGTCQAVTVAGRRPLLAEIQALVAPTCGPHPRRGVTGLEATRVGLVLAVLEQRAQVPLSTKDVWVATCGGIKISDPAADLALGLALHSAAVDQVLPAGLVALGELGLSGELRPVPALERRLAEAARLGATLAVVPDQSLSRVPAGLEVLAVPDLRGAVRVAGARRLSAVAASRRSS